MVLSSGTLESRIEGEGVDGWNNNYTMVRKCGGNMYTAKAAAAVYSYQRLKCTTFLQTACPRYKKQRPREAVVHTGVYAGVGHGRLGIIAWIPRVDHRVAQHNDRQRRRGEGGFEYLSYVFLAKTGQTEESAQPTYGWSTRSYLGCTLQRNLGVSHF